MSSCVMCSLIWKVESIVHAAQTTDPDPGFGPPGKRFIPRAMRTKVLQWGHDSKLFCHPGTSGTLYQLRQHFWWSNMEADIREYVAACPTHMRQK